MSQIYNGRTPGSLNEVQQFVGLVEYLAQFMPDICISICYTINGDLDEWTPIPVERNPRSMLPDA